MSFPLPGTRFASRRLSARMAVATFRFINLKELRLHYVIRDGNVPLLSVNEYLGSVDVFNDEASRGRFATVCLAFPTRIHRGPTVALCLIQRPAKAVNAVNDGNRVGMLHARADEIKSEFGEREFSS